jgi:hypothetical protein
MPGSAEILAAQEARPHPLLATTELTPIDAILTDPKAIERGMADIYESHPDIRAQIEAVELGYVLLAETGEVTQERIHRMIDHQFASASIANRAETLWDDWLEDEADTIVSDMYFCWYLDFAFPIDEQDTVTPRPDEDGPYWVDYVLKQGDILAGRLHDEPQYDPQVAEDTGEESAPTPTELLRQRLAGYSERTRHAKWIDTALVLGGAAVIAASETIAPHGVGSLGADAGGIAEFLTAYRVLTRTAVKRGLNREIQESLTTEKLAATLPVIAPEYGTEFAIESLVHAHALARAKSQSAWEGTSEASEPEQQIDATLQEQALREIARDLSVLSKHNGIEHAIAWVVQDLLRDQGRVDVSGDRWEATLLRIRTNILDRYLPIDQERDRLTPVNPLTGEKTWAEYIAWLAKAEGAPTRLTMSLAAHQPINGDLPR